jgi:hypothetical protein
MDLNTFAELSIIHYYSHDVISVLVWAKCQFSSASATVMLWFQPQKHPDTCIGRLCVFMFICLF